MREALAVIGGYLLGSIPVAFLVAKAAAGVDIRTVGSGNIGATNVFRAAGKTAGFFTLAMDVLKGWLPVFLADRYLPGAWPVAVGLAAVLGHTWSPFMGFRGGKGVATSAGVFMALLPKAMGVSLGVFLVGFLISRRVSIGSIMAAMALPLSAKLLGADPLRISLAAVLAVIVLVKHRSNMRRIAAGEEPKVTFRRREDSNNE